MVIKEVERPVSLATSRDALRTEMAEATSSNDYTSPRIVGVSEVASRLHVSEKTVRTWCRSGSIPSFKPAGSNTWLISERKLVELIEGGGESWKGM